ncbi:MAG: hypothetical protein K5647_00220 [Clostridiales bacterium]|nr:hypothetical protein [Clostridiales bacterium]
MENNSGKLLLFEGIVSVSALINASLGGTCRRSIKRVIAGRKRAVTERRRIDYIRSASAKLGFPLEFADESDIDAMTGGRTHGGIVAEASEAIYPGAGLLDPAKYPFSVLLDGIEDPYSLGHAARSLWCCGADAIIIPRIPYMSDPVVCRASAGAFELIPVFVCKPEEAAGRYRSAGVKTVSAGIRDSVDIYDAVLSLPLLLLCGGENRGISSALSALSDITVRIPYARPFRGSLPAETAVSVFAYEIMNRNRPADPNIGSSGSL